MNNEQYHYEEKLIDKANQMKYLKRDNNKLFKTRKEK